MLGTGGLIMATCKDCANERYCPPKEQAAMEALSKFAKGECKCSGYKPKDKKESDICCPFCGAIMRKGG